MPKRYERIAADLPPKSNITFFFIASQKLQFKANMMNELDMRGEGLAKFAAGLLERHSRARK